MTDTINDVAATKKRETCESVHDEQSVAEQPVAHSSAQGMDLVGPAGLLTRLTSRSSRPRSRRRWPSIWATTSTIRSGEPRQLPQRVRSKTVLTEIGPVEIAGEVFGVGDGGGSFTERGEDVDGERREPAVAFGAFRWRSACAVRAVCRTDCSGIPAPLTR